MLPDLIVIQGKDVVGDYHRAHTTCPLFWDDKHSVIYNLRASNVNITSRGYLNLKLYNKSVMEGHF